MKLVRSKLTFANVTAVIALFIALGSGAYAISSKAPKDSVNSRAIVDNSVKSADVKDNSLTGADIDQSTLSGGGEGGGGSGGPPSGPAGGDLAGNYPKPQIAANAIGSGNLKDGAVTATKLGDIITVGNNAHDTNTAAATCPDGTQVISGGGFALGAPLTQSYASAPLGTDGLKFWQVSTYPQTASSIFAYAYCLAG